MTSGSDLTHLIVTLRALVDEGENRVALAGITGDPAVPAADPNAVIDRRVGWSLLDGRKDRSAAHLQAFQKVDDVVHRHAPAAVLRRHIVHPLAQPAGVGIGDGHCEAFDEHVYVAQELAEGKLCMALHERAVALDHDLERPCCELGSRGPKSIGRGRKAGSEARRRQAKARMTHGTAVYRAPYDLREARRTRPA